MVKDYFPKALYMTEQALETLEIPGGNTKTTPESKQPTQCLHWCFTWNKYIQADIETLETLFKHLSHKYAFQEETGNGTVEVPEGTPHLQGVVSLKKRARWSEFGLPKGIHWEKCINVTRSYLYCTKADTRTGRVFTYNYELPFTQELPSLFNWEKQIIEIIDSGPESRKIHWFWEPTGCAGKTTFQKYIFGKYSQCVVLSGKGADMKNGIVTYKKQTGILPKIVLINIPRSVDDQFISFTGIEEVKDMFFYSGKYEGGMICGASPLVICFANRAPDLSEMSADRWVVSKIQNDG